MKKLKILVIDSSPIIYIGLKSVFKNSNLFDVTTFIDIKNNIIDVLNEFEIDIIISEINHKDSSVYDILKVPQEKKLSLIRFRKISWVVLLLILLFSSITGFFMFYT